MNHEEIDRQLIELLRTPAQERTPGIIESSIALICTAAELETAPATPTQQEQIKLIAIIERLACDLKTTNNNVTLELSADDPNPIHQALHLSMRLPNGNYLFGWGRTAEETLRDMREVVPTKAKAA
ncbi:hypothetical protein ALQ04_01648 [Pseudomonas cichorii]|uniref:Uncharacterized protein n=1 Tax=Pseudomonas cichorii TaxID=36746 RepID=A0A3M4LX06_PSECI|nr:hypothetical protein [Pseudomonas cichorii]RMQ45999.1 hypothetical protein ALQ04_01648 [Pseudomonas cichorii]